MDPPHRTTKRQRAGDETPPASHSAVAMSSHNCEFNFIKQCILDFDAPHLDGTEGSAFSGYAHQPDNTGVISQ